MEAQINTEIMKKNFITKWSIIFRAYSWPASITPMLIGIALAYKKGHFSFLDSFLTLIAGLFLHSAANLANTYFDFKNGVDKKGSDDIAIVEGFISPEKALSLSLSLFFISALIGILLVFKNKVFLLLPVSVLGFLLAWFYTAGFAYKYKALGELGIFLCFGPLIVSGTVLIQTGKVELSDIIASIPTGLLIVGILFANNIRDTNSDMQSKIKTLPQILGEKKSLYFYYFLLFFSYFTAFLFLKNIYFLIFIFSLPFALKLVKIANKKDFVNLVRQTAAFVGIFGVNFVLAILLA